jgi:peptidoglycan/xylan/chitin deacetylase (PgdA/CDA1 family)
VSEDVALLRPARGHAVRLGAAMYYRGLRALGATALRRRCQDAGLILCYHNVISGGNDQAGDPGLHLSRARFAWQMQWLADHYDILSLSHFVRRLIRGATLRGTAVVTFDDGYAGVFTHAVPILKKLRIPATVFVVGEAPGRSAGFWWDHPEIAGVQTAALRERWLTQLRGDEAAILSHGCTRAVGDWPAAHRPADWAAMRAHVGAGIDIGVHSATHRSLPTLTDAELEHEIVAGRLAVREGTGVWPEFFAYPYGLWDSRVRTMVRNARYQAALTVSSGLVRPGQDRWCLRRINVPAQISDAAFEAWTAGFHAEKDAVEET